MNRILEVIFVGILLFSGCDASGQAQQNTPEATAQQQTNGPRIVLTNAELTYDGKPLKLGAPLEEWIEVIGEKPREHLRRNFYVWDSLGLVVSMMPNDKNLVRGLHIELNWLPKDPYVTVWEEDKPGKGFLPASLFQSYLEFEGAKIRADSTVSEIGKKCLKKEKLTHFIAHAEAVVVM